MTNIKWTDELISSCQAVLAKHSSEDIGLALTDISKVVGRPVSYDSISKAFSSRRIPSPHSFLRSDTQPAKLHPVQLLETKETVSRDKQHLAQVVLELRDARKRQSFLDEIEKHSAPPKILSREKKSGVRELTAVVLASDWHVEEVVEPESVSFLNEYNLKISERRVKKFFDGIIWNVEHHRASKKIVIRDLVLWLGGDLMTGYIHEELVETNELSPTETMLWLLPLLKDGIKTVLDVLKLETITIPCSYGNHGRVTEKSRISSGYANSFEWLMYNVLRDSFKPDNRVKFEITASSHQYVQVYNRMLHFHHGDSLRYNGGVGGLGVPLLKRVPNWDLVKKADVHNIGHFHTLLDYGNAVVNGSLIGFGAYAQSIGAKPEPPQQAMYYVDSTRGKCMTTAIWVGDQK